jgi:ABC-type nickel/cobalt efflux system permease component RcnA
MLGAFDAVNHQHAVDRAVRQRQGGFADQHRAIVAVVRPGMMPCCAGSRGTMRTASPANWRR